MNIPRQAPLRVPERYSVTTPPNERARSADRPLAHVLTDIPMHRPISEREARHTRHIRRRFQDPDYEQNSDSESNDNESADEEISDAELEPPPQMSDLSIHEAIVS